MDTQVRTATIEIPSQLKLGLDELFNLHENIGELRKIQTALHKLRKVQFRQIKSDAFDVLEPRLQSEVKIYGNANSSVPYDAPLRRVERIDNNGLKFFDYLGQRSFIHDFTRPARRVVSFRTPNGPVAANGMFLR